MNALSDEKDRKAYRKKEKHITWFIYIVSAIFTLAHVVFNVDSFIALNIIISLILVIEFLIVHFKMKKYH